MKIRCHRPSLAHAFQVVSGVVPARTPKDILKNVKLTVHDGSTTLIGTDQEVGIRCEVPGVEVESPGQTLLPTARVVSILRELTDDGVELELTGERVMIRAGRSEFTLAAEDADEFPDVAAFDAQQYHVVPSDVFQTGIRRTVPATDVESTRYALGGVLLELDAEKMTMVATDSRRLAVFTGPCRREGEAEAVESRPVIPSKAMTLIDRSIDEETEEVQVAVRGSDVLVKCGSSTIQSRLVEGRFPRYQDVIPTEWNAEVEVLAGPLYSAVRQAQIVTDEESRGVDFVFASDGLTLSSQAPDVGQSKIEIPISYGGEPLTITFDPRYIADFLRVLEPEAQVKLQLIDSESAAVFRCGDDFLYVVMPLARER